MTDISAISSTMAAGNPAAPKAGTQMGKDQFLKLFVAQLQHQDPMNPMQDSDFMGQMASFSTLEQVTNMASENAKSNAIGLLGHTVTYKDKDGATQTGVVEKYSTVDQVVSMYTFVPDQKLAEANAKVLAEWTEALSDIDTKLLPDDQQDNRL